jgi:ABC-type branched-subunit amino acid transport system substrate-binding protein
MKRILIVLAVAGLLLGACKSSNDAQGPAAGDTQGTGAPSGEDGAGVTADTIKLGVVYLDFSKLKDVIPSLDQGNYETAYQSYAKVINDAGGINGRKLELVFATFDPIDQSTASTACLQLTEDEKVFAVVAAATTPAGSSCILVDHSTPMVGGTQTEEALDAARAPWFAWDPSSASAAHKTVGGVLDEGGFEGKKVAIVAAAADEGVARQTETQLKDAGVDVVNVAIASAPSGDASAAKGELQTFAERFRSDGADQVVVIGDAFVLFAQALQQTDYRPQLIATSSGVVRGFLVAASDYAVMKGLIAGGPPSPQSVAAEPVVKECHAAVQAVEPDRVIDSPYDPSGKSPEPWISVESACTGLQLFAAIAEKAGSTLNNDTFAQAGQDLGMITLPGRGGPSNYTPDHPDGQPPLFLARWDESSNTLVVDANPVG